jgi:hypothetical protein
MAVVASVTVATSITAVVPPSRVHVAPITTAMSSGLVNVRQARLIRVTAASWRSSGTGWGRATVTLATFPQLTVIESFTADGLSCDA